MATADGKLNLVYGATEINVDMPIFPYRTIIKLPFDITLLDTGRYKIYDHGANDDAYDIRSCECDIELTAAEMYSLTNFLTLSNQARGKDVTVSMSSGSGFFPFGPDKGDTGPFTCAMEIVERQGIGSSPYLYFKAKVRFTNTDNTSWPSYSLPTQVSEGGLTIGTITNLRFPPNWFRPNVTNHAHVAILQDASSEWMDRGIKSSTTRAQMACNESKAAALINYLTQTARANQFTITIGDNMYPFDRDYGTSGSFNVLLIQDQIEITHSVYNRFEFDLTLSRDE